MGNSLPFGINELFHNIFTRKNSFWQEIFIKLFYSFISIGYTSQKRVEKLYSFGSM